MNARILLMLMAIVALSGCSSRTDDLQAWIKQVKARKSKAIDPIPKITPYEPFEYVPPENVDPFSPPQGSAEPAGHTLDANLRPDANRPREPLEAFSLDGLKMLGTIQAGNDLYALVKSPDGIVHRVSVGNHMGLNYGRVDAVSESEITLTEIVPDGFGGWTKRSARLSVPER